MRRVSLAGYTKLPSRSPSSPGSIKQFCPGIEPWIVITCNCAFDNHKAASCNRDGEHHIDTGPEGGEHAC